MSSDDGGHLGAMRNPESITNTVAIHNRSMDDWWETTKKSLSTSSGRSVSYSAAADGEAMGFFIIFLVVPALCVWAMMCWEAFKVSTHGGILTLTSIPLLSAAVMLVLFIWHEFEDWYVRLLGTLAGLLLPGAWAYCCYVFVSCGGMFFQQSR